jgi:NADH-quinone oxidoreductase subunit M
MGRTSGAVTPNDLSGREHTAMWPMIALMLLMGVASPYWMRAIDQAGTSIAQVPAAFEAEPATSASAQSPAFVDPELKAAALKELDRQAAEQAAKQVTEGGKR